jgi:hypothetical protein
MRRGHSSHGWLVPAARTAVKGARAVCAAKRARPLTAAAAEGTRGSACRRPLSASSLCLQRVYAAPAARLSAPERRSGLFRLAARIQQVNAWRQVNAQFFRIPRPYLYDIASVHRRKHSSRCSYPAGDDVSTFIRCAAARRRAGPCAWWVTPAA